MSTDAQGKLKTAREALKVVTGAGREILREMLKLAKSKGYKTHDMRSRSDGKRIRVGVYDVPITADLKPYVMGDESKKPEKVSGKSIEDIREELGSLRKIDIACSEEGWAIRRKGLAVFGYKDIDTLLKILKKAL